MISSVISEINLVTYMENSKLFLIEWIWKIRWL